MVRTYHPIGPTRQQTNPPPPGPPTPYAAGGGSHSIQDSVVLRNFEGDGSEMIMVPFSYEDRADIGPDAEWREREFMNAESCWKTTEIYSHIEDHPRLVR
jgi:hypothetical protein